MIGAKWLSIADGRAAKRISAAEMYQMRSVSVSWTANYGERWRALAGRSTLDPVATGNGDEEGRKKKKRSHRRGQS